MSAKRKLQVFLSDMVELDLFYANTEEEGDSILEDGVEALVLASGCRYGTPRLKIPKHMVMFTHILPNMDERRFRRNLRMSREQFYNLLAKIENHPVFSTRTKQQVPTIVQLAVTVYRLGVFGNGSSIMNVAREFGLSDGGIILESTRRVLTAIVSLQNDYVKWPDAIERKSISYELGLSKFPHCVGFIDGTHILLFAKPEDDGDDYINRKNQPSIQLQLVTDKKKSIRHFYVGFPGSVHDSRVYASSEIAKHPSRYFTAHEYLLGDSGYPISARLICPYRKSNGLTDDKRKFNTQLSKQRVVVEQAIGILKKRFASLNGLRIRVNKTKGHKLACDWISCCCIIHNFLVGDPWTQTDIDDDLENGRMVAADEEDQEDNLEEGGNLEGVTKREVLKEFVLSRFRN